MGSTWVGGTVATFPYIPDPPLPAEYPLAASGQYSYAIDPIGGSVTFDPPVDSVTFFYVHDALYGLGVPPGLATAIDVCGDVVATEVSYQATFFNDPANYVSFIRAPGGMPLRSVTFDTGGAIDAFTYTASKGGLEIGGNSTFTADGVMFYIKGGRVDIAGNSTIWITPIDPTIYSYPNDEGVYDRVSFFQAHDNPHPPSTVNTAHFVGSVTTNIFGKLYFPATEVEIGGTPQNHGEQLISWTTWLHGGHKIDPGCGAGLAHRLLIKPDECVAPLNPNSQGVIPVVLVGDDFLDVSAIDLSTLQLSRSDGVGGSASPNEGPPGPHSKFVDTAQPDFNDPCECDEGVYPDHVMDLSMKFKTADLVEALELGELPAGTILDLLLTGSTYDGVPFQGHDCIRIVANHLMQGGLNSSSGPRFGGP